MGNRRSRARERAVQALYQWQMTGQDIGDIDTEFLAERDMSNADVDLFRQLLRGVPGHLREIDGLITPHLDRPLEQVDPVERAILRIGTYELTYCPDVPYRVAINEAVELAKRYGAEQGHRYINSILDKVSHGLGEDRVVR